MYTILNNIYFIFIFLMSTVFLPSLLILLKPIQFLFDTKLNWQTNAHIFLYYLCGIKHEVENKDALINKGYILCNHRSFFDFAVDPYVTNSSIVGRKEAFRAVSVSYVLGLLDNRMIVFTRGIDNRNSLFKLMKTNLDDDCDRVMFYPEGSRLKYEILESPDDVKSKLKYGILKSIYEDKMDNIPVQLCITSNKDKVFNEKKLYANYGVELKTKIGKPIYTTEYDTFEEFIDEVSREWFHLWKSVYKI